MFEIIEKRFKELGETGWISDKEYWKLRKKLKRVINSRINKIGSTILDGGLDNSYHLWWGWKRVACGKKIWRKWSENKEIEASEMPGMSVR